MPLHRIPRWFRITAVFIAVSFVVAVAVGQPLPLSFTPSTGTGLTAEFQIRSIAAALTLIVNTSNNSVGACYATIDPVTPAVYVRRDSTGQWGAAGDRCGMAVQRDGTGLKLMVTFTGVWTGAQSIYLMERPGGQWQQVGTWTVQAPPPPPPPVSTTATLRGVIERIKVTNTPMLTQGHHLAFNPAPGTLINAVYRSQYAVSEPDTFARDVFVTVPWNAAIGDTITIAYWTYDPLPLPGPR